MSNFDDVEIEWEGTKYTIKKDRVLGAIARIEDVVTMSELQRFWDRGTAPMAKIAMAYGAVLRYAGAKISDDDVYAGMFTPGKTTSDAVVLSVSHLIEMMVPPVARKVLKEKIEKEDKQEKSQEAENN